MKNRQLLSSIKAKQNHRHGRLISICGARQTGKTTLCRQVASDFAYISMDDPILRNEYLKLTANDWVEKYPKVIIDEIQKAGHTFNSGFGHYLGLRFGSLTTATHLRTRDVALLIEVIEPSVFLLDADLRYFIRHVCPPEFWG